MVVKSGFDFVFFMETALLLTLICVSPIIITYKHIVNIRLHSKTVVTMETKSISLFTLHHCLALTLFENSPIHGDNEVGEGTEIS